jgi:hypothetical protein
VSRERAIQILQILDSIARRLEADETQGDASLSVEQAMQVNCIRAAPPPERHRRRPGRKPATNMTQTVDLEGSSSYNDYVHNTT